MPILIQIPTDQKVVLLEHKIVNIPYEETSPLRFMLGSVKALSLENSLTLYKTGFEIWNFIFRLYTLKKNYFFLIFKEAIMEELTELETGAGQIEEAVNNFLNLVIL